MVKVLPDQQLGSELISTGLRLPRTEQYAWGSTTPSSQNSYCPQLQTATVTVGGRTTEHDRDPQHVEPIPLRAMWPRKSARYKDLLHLCRGQRTTGVGGLPTVLHSS